MGRCIETAARQRHRRLVEQMLQSASASALEAQEADLLRVFLETADFPRLRAQSEAVMAEGRRVVFEIVDDGEGVSWQMEER